MTNDALSIVMVDDDEGHATLLRRGFSRCGLSAGFLRLRDGQELIDYLQRRNEWSGRPTHGAIVIILDLNMPRLGGFDVLQALKRDARYARIPVIVLTTTDNPGEIDRCYALGAAACIVKPVDYGAFDLMASRLAGFIQSVQLPAEQAPFTA